jgi:hypothetical protein
MKSITGFRLRKEAKQADAAIHSFELPPAFSDTAARDRVIGKIRSMGEAFFQMPEHEYGDWLNALPQDEFLELIALNYENNKSA